jgi:methylmalonyl-CoA/ethylmalonyl-CoA epimerase
VLLDHIAVAVERWSDAWPRYVHQLGGTWHSGGTNIGFSPAQLSYANGARVEVLQPWEPETNPFLRRFLDHSGPGPHHLTFKVTDIEAVLARVRAAGFEPVGVRLSDPQWREAFLHPREATGVVVQVAQEQFPWVSPPPEGFPTPVVAPAALCHVTHAVRHLDVALELFHVLLGGALTTRAVAGGGAWEYADLAWPGPLGVRLVAPAPGGGGSSPLAGWLGHRQGRVHHLAFELPGPFPASSAPVGASGEGGAGDPVADVPGVIPGTGPVQVVEADDNLGMALVLRPPGGGA